MDRPGIGSSTPHQYSRVLEFGDDLRTIADVLGIDKMAVIGLSGGGPCTLATAAAMPDRVMGGRGARRCGADGRPRRDQQSVDANSARRSHPILQVAGAPIRLAASGSDPAHPAGRLPALEIYARISPEGDRAHARAARVQGHVPR